MTAAENAATVREALRIGGMTGKQPHAALDALLAKAETADDWHVELQTRLIDAEAERDAAVRAAEQLQQELPKSEGDARAGGNPDASSGIAPAPTRSGEARSGRTPQGRTPAQLADTVLRFGGPTWDERSRAALAALLANAEAAVKWEKEYEWVGALNKANIENGDRLRAERDAAVQAAEQAQEALRPVFELYDDMARHYGDEPEDWWPQLYRARAALTGEGTERYDCGGECTERCEHEACVQRPHS